MSETGKKAMVDLHNSKQEDCLKQLKASGATPKHMLLGLLILNVAPVVRAATFGALLAGAYFGVGK